MEAIESTIVKLLSETSGDILEVETLINTFADSKKPCTDIGEKVDEAERACRRCKLRMYPYGETIVYAVLCGCRDVQY